jgi:hypothetical protein
MTAGMKRFVYSFLGALLVLVPVPAWAQSGTTGTTGTTATTQAIQPGLVVKRAGTQLKNEPVIYVTRANCFDNVEYEFSVKYVAAVPVTEVWVGVGGEDCSSRASRERTQISSTSVCRLVGRANSSLNPTIKVRALDLFSSDADDVDDGESTDDADAGSDAGSPLDAGADTDAAEDAGAFADVVVEEVGGTGATSCDAATNLQYKVFFIPLPQPTNTSANRAYDPLPVMGYGYSTLIATFTLFTEIPDAPAGVSNRDGEAEIGVSFTPLAGALAKTTYKAYFDWGTGGEGDCGSGALIEGQQPPPEDATVAAVSASRTGTLKNLDDKGIPLDSYVAATVVTVDPAGNESNVGEVVCVKREETINFVDRCRTDSDCKLESCSVQFPSRRAGGLGLLALVAAAVGLFVRRRQA